MKVTILYFAALRERVGTGREVCALPAAVTTVDALKGWLASRGAPWSEASLLGLARGYEAITADAPWRALEPTELAAAADPVAPTPADRMAAMAGAAAI